MLIYDSFGTFDATEKKFNLAVQLTNIDTDIYEITGYYNVCNPERYAIVAILQTKDGNDKDLTNDPTDCACLVSDITFTDLDNSYLEDGDKDIFEVVKDDIIHVIVHHAIDFDPLINPDDDLYIKNYKADTYTYYPNASKPGKGGKGLMI